jgi:predicted AAA+ superfamily ATPase
VEYTQRVIDAILDEIWSEAAAVAIEGAKGVGKTATASRRARTIFALNVLQTRRLVAANYDLVAEADPPVFIDEWQLVEQVWERVRTAVDDDPMGGGRFLLAGSAGLARDARIHSGAGRILRLVMRPMSLVERGVATPTVSLQELHSGEAEIGGSSDLKLKDYVEEILRSGFPGIRDLSLPLRDLQLDSYLDRIVDHDLHENGITVRRPAALRSWLQAYGAATASTTDYTKILNAATAGEADKPARNTVDGYREHLTRLFILDPLEAWLPAFVPLKRLTAAPKHHLVDPALAARMVGVGAKGLMLGEGDTASPTAGTWLGALFESLAVQSVRTYASALHARVAHLRTAKGEHEVDIIVEGRDLNIVALEVKLADTIEDADVKHLLWLKSQTGERMKDAVLLYTGTYAYRRPDGVAVVPLALLGP